MPASSKGKHEIICEDPNHKGERELIMVSLRQSRTCDVCFKRRGTVDETFIVNAARLDKFVREEKREEEYMRTGEWEVVGGFVSW